MKTVFQTDNEGYFVGVTQADPDPLTPNSWLIPAGCVDVPPPATGTREAARWNAGTWQIVPDFRGHTYWLPDGGEHVITERGVAPPANALSAKPPKPLSEAKADKLKELERARKRAIDTLPPVTVANKQYPATPEYREVVTGIARRQAAGRPIPATLRGVDGAPATLNAALITQIDDAITSAVQAVWDRYWTRFDAVQAATTTAEAESIVW